jgi:uncharacterized lipoprotein YddW (UPF0748 family)
MTTTARLAAGAALSALAFASFAMPGVHAADDVRAMWIGRTNLMSPQSIDDALASAKRENYNTVLVQARARGDAYFLKGIEPRPVALSSLPAFDPLAESIAKGHARGLSVHAWINVNLVAGTEAPGSRTHIVYRHPEWLMVPRQIADDLKSLDPDGPEYLGRLMRYSRSQAAVLEGVYLSPATPGAVEYTAGIVRDIVQRYAVDGVHFDYVRYPNDDFDYGRETLRVFGQNPSTAPDRWRQFRADRLTALLTTLRGVVKEARPSAIVSASQDAAWPQGLLDTILRRTPEPSADTLKASTTSSF